MAERLYYLSVQGDQKGPFTIIQLRSMWQTGAVTADALVWYDGQSEWTPVTGMAFLLNPATPVVTVAPTVQTTIPRPDLVRKPAENSGTRINVASPHQPDQLPLLWSSGRSRWVALFLGPIGGSLFLAQNWWTLGKRGEAVFCFLLSVGITLGGSALMEKFWPECPLLVGLLIIFLVWLVAVESRFRRYVAVELQDSYNKRKTGWALALVFVVLMHDLNAARRGESGLLFTNGVAEQLSETVQSDVAQAGDSETAVNRDQGNSSPVTPVSQVVLEKSDQEAEEIRVALKVLEPRMPDFQTVAAEYAKALELASGAANGLLESLQAYTHSAEIRAAFASNPTRTQAIIDKHCRDCYSDYNDLLKKNWEAIEDAQVPRKHAELSANVSFLPDSSAKVVFRRILDHCDKARRLLKKYQIQRQLETADQMQQLSGIGGEMLPVAKDLRMDLELLQATMKAVPTL